MLCPLSRDDDYWTSMFHIWMIYINALTVVMRRWQLMEHDSYLRDISQCSYLCHEMMTTDGACFIRDIFITMLWPLSWDADICKSMFHTLGMNNHALSVVKRRRHLTEHVSYMRDILPFSDRCHETMTTDGACIILEGYITMLWPLSWDDDNRRSMFQTLWMNNHAMSVVRRRWQQTEHVSCMRYIYHHALTVVMTRR